jgi:hypothetical protein
MYQQLELKKLFETQNLEANKHNIFKRISLLSSRLII